MSTQLYKMVQTYYDVQHMRMILDARHRSTDDPKQYLELTTPIKQIHDIEDTIEANIQDAVTLYPIHHWIIGQAGVKYTLAAQLVGLIQDIRRFDNVSKLWAYFGLAAVDICQTCGKRWYPDSKKAGVIAHIKERQKEQNEKKKYHDPDEETTPAESMVCNCEHPKVIKGTQRHIKGTLADYNPTAKKLAVYVIGSQFIKQGKVYRELYDQFRAEYEQREDLRAEVDSRKGKKTKNGESKGTAHIYSMARRKMVKVFLQHLWITWRKLEGLPVTDPYVIDQMKHSKIIEPPSPTIDEIRAKIAGKK